MRISSEFKQKILNSNFEMHIYILKLYFDKMLIKFNKKFNKKFHKYNYKFNKKFHNTKKKI